MKVESGPHSGESLSLSEARTACLLSEQVRLAVERYFAQLDGHSASNLYEIVLNEVERPLIEAVLVYCGHNQSKAAQVLGLSRGTLRKKMNHHEID